MILNKYRYKIIEKSEKIYCDMTAVELRKKLNTAFAKSVQEDELTGIVGKYQKRADRYKVKYIYSRNAQLQPKTYERYYLLAKTGSDENGVYIEHALVYDKLFEPLVRISYILTVLLIIGCLMYLMKKEMLDSVSAYTLSAIAAATVLVVLKKSRRSVDESRKATEIFKKLVNSF